MSIRSRILVSLGSMFSILVVLVATTLFVVHKQKSDGLVINLAGRQRMLTQKMSKEVLHLFYLRTTGGSGEKEVEKALENTKNIFDVTLNALISSGYAPLTLKLDGPKKMLPPASGAALLQLKKVKAIWIPFKTQVEKILHDGDRTAFEHVLAKNISLLKEMNKAVFLLQKSADQKVSLLKVICIAGIFLGIFVIFFVGWWMDRTLISPVSELAMFAQQVSSEYSGEDKSLDVSDKKENEIKLLDSAIHTMVEKLKEEITRSREALDRAEIMAKEAENARIEAEEAMKRAVENENILRQTAHQINEMSERIVTASEDLSQKADEVSEGANIQKQRVLETATAMEEMNATVLEVAKNAAQAAESADNARTQAEKGAKIVDEAVSAINEINVLTEKLKANMDVLKEKADGISQVMTVISDIADQTNLLALNAAIEAARAGEAGRGFAVVADEVRKLAEKTMNATKEVGDAINEIQEEVKKDVREMEKAAESVARGTALSNDSKKALEEIVNLVISISDQIRAIATASEEQSAASDEITMAINEINEISDVTTNNIEDIRGEIQQFVVMSGELKEMVEQLLSE
ncbi:hypothetical protein JCM13304A_04560 [Desulfothermus okinawensis JCM 13304]